MQNMPNDPKYSKNAEKFFGIDNDIGRNKKSTYAERLKTFIGN